MRGGGQPSVLRAAGFGRRARAVSCLALIAVLAACGAQGRRPAAAVGGHPISEIAAGQERLPTAVFYIEKAGGGAVSLVAELAVSDEERSAGLMFRQSLPDGEGMLFIFERDEWLSFWMKNTIIPLSIAFIASDGAILEIRDMWPLDLVPVNSSLPARYALEVPQGWFERVGVRVGDVVRRQ